MKSMFRNEVDIILLEENSVGLVTTAKVPVLMKSVWYHTTSEKFDKRYTCRCVGMQMWFDKT